jgi:cytochrome c553
MTLLITATASAGEWRALVTEGERWWSQSPDPDRPVACATCHHDPEAIRGWAASFPKVRPMPPPHTRVMTLFQANAEAVARHYGLRDPRPAAAAITAFLTAQGAGRPISPGMTPDQPVFPARMRALAASVERGRKLYEQRCRGCHGYATNAPGAGSFRYATSEPVEVFLEGHRPTGDPIPWNSRVMADLLAYLLARHAGEPVTAEGPPGAVEVSR